MLPSKEIKLHKNEIDGFAVGLTSSGLHFRRSVVTSVVPTEPPSRTFQKEAPNPATSFTASVVARRVIPNAYERTSFATSKNE